ncbi:MAG: tetratricopeptide repeat protein [Gemmatimonadota bacterium]|nr:tetratricopeptide repeat protein [Gemmatimonadota bacterium]
MLVRKLITKSMPLAVLLMLVVLGIASRVEADSRRLDSDSKLAIRLYNEGGELLDQEKFDQAMGKLTRAIEEDPSFLQAHFRYMDVLRATGKSEQMVEEYRRKTLRNPESALWIFLYGRALDDPAEKRRQYRAALKADPGFYWAQYGIGGLCLLERRYDEAIIALNKTLEIKPGMFDALYLLGTVYLEKGMLIQARGKFEDALVADGTSAAVYLSLGRVYSQLERPGSAEKAFRKAAALEPENPLPQYYIGLVCEMSGQKARAIKAYESFLDIDPEHELAGIAADNIKRLRE